MTAHNLRRSKVKSFTLQLVALNSSTSRLLNFSTMLRAIYFPPNCN